MEKTRIFGVQNPCLVPTTQFIRAIQTNKQKKMHVKLNELRVVSLPTGTTTTI